MPAGDITNGAVTRIGISIPETFSDGDFKTWLRRYELCCDANGWDEQTRAKKLPTLLSGKLNCSGPKSSLPFRKYLLILKKLLIGLEENSEDQNSLLCGQDINKLCLHILTKQLPEDVKYYTFDYIKDDPELQEFVFRISVVVGLVALTIFCNFCKWMTANELHYDEDYEEKTRRANVSKVFEKAAKVSNDTPVSQISCVNKTSKVESVTPPNKQRENGCQTWGFWKICAVILAVFAMLSIPWEFARLYQKEISKRAAHALIGSPPECFPGGMSFLQSLKSLLRSHFSWDHVHDPCEKYYYTLLVDPLWELTPLMVLLSAMTRCILHPMEQLFSGLGRSCQMFFTEIPAQWQPVIMVLLMLLFVILLLMVFSYRISIPLLFRIEPKTPVQLTQASSRKEPVSSCSHNHAHSHTQTHKLAERQGARLQIPARMKGCKNRLEFEDSDIR